jgi:hypothetical protein
MAEITEREFGCRISIRLEDEDDICRKLRKALPALKWQTGDSEWDKIRVWGETADVFVRVYRYEEPGLFLLTVRLKTPDAASAEREYHVLRDTVLLALEATVLPEP